MRNTRYSQNPLGKGGFDQQLIVQHQPNSQQQIPKVPKGMVTNNQQDIYKAYLSYMPTGQDGRDQKQTPQGSNLISGGTH